MKGVILMDGGMGAELMRRGAIRNEAIWSASALLDSPNVVQEVHEAFIAAGARLIISNSYACVPGYLSRAGIAHRCRELAGLSGRLARAAAGSCPDTVLVAGGLPPLSDSYRADLVPDDESAGPVYLDLAGALEPFVDLFICETMSSIRESRNAVRAAKQVAEARNIPVYVAWTLDERPGHGLRSGESIKDAWRELSQLDVDGFLFNCTHPDAIETGVAEIATLTDKPTGGYPNRFDVPGGWTIANELEVQPRADEGTEQFVAAALRWIALGATVVGGCCEVRPADIAALSRRLRQN